MGEPIVIRDSQGSVWGGRTSCLFWAPAWRLSYRKRRVRVEAKGRGGRGGRRPCTHSSPAPAGQLSAGEKCASSQHSHQFFSLCLTKSSFWEPPPCACKARAQEGWSPCQDGERPCALSQACCMPARGHLKTPTPPRKGSVVATRAKALVSGAAPSRSPGIANHQSEGEKLLRIDCTFLLWSLAQK